MARATVAHRGGRRFEGLVAGQPSHASTNRSAFEGRCFVAHHCAVERESNRRGLMVNTRPDLSQAW